MFPDPDPTTWPTPDEYQSTEYSIIYKHAMAVWNSNANELPSERSYYVRSSLRDMHEWLGVIIQNGSPEVSR